MNIRIMTIRVVCALAWAAAPLASGAAEEGERWTNPLRSPDREPAAESLLQPYPTPPPTAEDAPPRPSPPWRNPNWFRPSGPAGAPGVERAPRGTAPAATIPERDAGRPPAAAPPRSLIQRIRERRLAQLEKQAERIRQLNAGENRPGPDERGIADPNGPENPDLQIDLGVPPDAPGPPAANPGLPEAPAGPPELPLHWSPAPPVPSASPAPPDPPAPPLPPLPAAVTPPTELNPPAAPPLEVNIELPSDVEPPQPKPAAQARVRNWWSAPR
ncbi:MAG: hypothetical protein GX575_27070 [Candidatus Anammoximicrobium sp.]|nr:hypothetical protein [Candidatus Anammoximicrobium sp.]